MDSVAYNNVLPWRGCEKLYLNSRTSDVHFILRSENGDVEKVPAHKNILSIISPVFDAMFYGPNKQDADIDIVDVSPEAFKEFLQFFYRRQVKLTAENVAEVLNLGRQYLLDDWEMMTNASINLMKSSLTLDNICMGYELAILFEMDDLKKFCEKKIGKYAAAVFKSSSFLECQPNLLRHILQLNTFTCDESVVFDGCMAWAKAECVRKQCDENDGKNLRAQLGDLFYEIRFGDFSLENFEQRYHLYDGLLSLEEFHDITLMIICKEYEPENFNRTPRSLAKIESIEKNENYIVVDRKKSRTIEYACSRRETTTKFVSTSKLRLKKISCFLALHPKSFRNSIVVEAKIRIYEGCKESRGTLVSFVQTSLNINENINIEFPEQIMIEPEVTYGIHVEVTSEACPSCYPEVECLKDGTVIEFDNTGTNFRSFVSDLHFIGSSSHLKI